VYTGNKIDLSSLKAELMVAMINCKGKGGFFFSWISNSQIIFFELVIVQHVVLLFFQLNLKSYT